MNSEYGIWADSKWILASVEWRVEQWSLVYRYSHQASRHHTHTQTHTQIHRGSDYRSMQWSEPWLWGVCGVRGDRRWWIVVCVVERGWGVVTGHVPNTSLTHSHIYCDYTIDQVCMVVIESERITSDFLVYRYRDFGLCSLWWMFTGDWWDLILRLQLRTRDRPTYRNLPIHRPYVTF